MSLNKCFQGGRCVLSQEDNVFFPKRTMCRFPKGQCDVSKEIDVSCSQGSKWQFLIMATWSFYLDHANYARAGLHSRPRLVTPELAYIVDPDKLRPELAYIVDPGKNKKTFFYLCGLPFSGCHLLRSDRQKTIARQMQNEASSLLNVCSIFALRKPWCK